MIWKRGIHFPEKVMREKKMSVMAILLGASTLLGEERDCTTRAEFS